MKLTEITDPADRCGDLLTCPAVFELTHPEDKCAFEGSCPGVFERSGLIVVIGKLTDVEGRVGDGEAAIEIDAGMLERALARRGRSE